MDLQNQSKSSMVTYKIAPNFSFERTVLIVNMNTPLLDGIYIMRLFNIFNLTSISIMHIFYLTKKPFITTRCMFAIPLRVQRGCINRRISASLPPVNIINSKRLSFEMTHFRMCVFRRGNLIQRHRFDTQHTDSIS